MEAPRVEVRSRAELRKWLSDNHESHESIWLVTWKKPSDHYLAYGEIVEEALCFGWIDSQPRVLDEHRAMLRLSRRKPESGWSAINKKRLKKLMDSGLMTAAGHAAIERAKRNGAWSRLDAAHAGIIPEDLARALAANGDAARNFDSFPASVRRSILEWISLAKRPETRAARIEQTATMAAKGERANQWRREPRS